MVSEFHERDSLIGRDHSREQNGFFFDIRKCAQSPAVSAQNGCAIGLFERDFAPGCEDRIIG